MKRSGKVYFLNRFYWPDSSATAQILTGLAPELARDFDVVVVTSRLNYADSAVGYPAREVSDGVTIRRLWSTRFGRGNVVGRLMDYVTIYLSFFVFLLSRLRSQDVLVVKTDPPMLSVLGALVKSVRGMRLVSWCQDIFPEVAMAEMRLPTPVRWGMQILQKLRDWSFRQSDRIVVLGEDMAAFLHGRGIAAEKLRIIANWSVQVDQFDAAAEAGLRGDWRIPADAFVVGYSGNLGRAHDYLTLLAAAGELAAEGDIVFTVCGGGYGYEQLRAAVEKEKLDNGFRFLPYQDKAQLGISLRVPDVHWLTLKARLSAFIYPSKFFGILQAGRPLIFIGERQSELARIIAESGAGAAVAEGDGAAMAAAIRGFRQDRQGCAAAGEAARAVWLQQFQRSSEIAKWRELLGELTEATAATGGRS